ncbi:MAG: sulfite exporter TauE/SafE family protein [Pirellulaceae bacterium]
MAIYSVIFGVIVGFSLGLTGGGGSIFAVPLLVYGLSVTPHDAVGVSLAAVGITALVGTLEQLRARQIEVRTGLIFALAGMSGAPLGSWLAGQMSDTLLLVLFAILMVIVAARMWKKAAATGPQGCDSAKASTCKRDGSGQLLMTSRCTILLSIVGVVAGVLAGLFGVGGGFVIVPALVIFSGMGIHRAVATSLLVITLISISGVSSHLLAGRSISPEITLLFVVGGIIGLFSSRAVGQRISGPTLQRVFAGAIGAVAAFVIMRTLS